MVPPRVIGLNSLRVSPRMGTTWAVGAPRHDTNGAESGQVRIYPIPSSFTNGAEERVGGWTIHGETAEGFIGIYAVSMSADETTLVVVGAPSNLVSRFGSGHVSVYKYDVAVDNYLPVGSDINGEELGEDFGDSIRMSADGTLFVGGCSIQR